MIIVHCGFWHLSHQSDVSAVEDVPIILRLRLTLGYLKRFAEFGFGPRKLGAKFCNEVSLYKTLVGADGV